MSEPNELSSRTSSDSSLPQPPSAPGSEVLTNAVQALPPPSAAEDDARARIAALEREAKALGNDPASALLFHEIGLLWEDPLKNPRNAAVAFQNAYKLSPRFVSNIRAARRLFADVGNWQMVIQLIDAELLATEDSPQRAALMLEKASVLEERLSRDEDASITYRQCLDQKPKDASLLLQLEGVYAGKQDFGPLVEVYQLMASTLEDVALRAHYLTAAGLLLEERLKKPEEAAACYREAFTLDKRDLLLLAAIKRVAEREGNHEELLNALAAEADVLGAQAAPTYLQLSKVYEKLGRKEDALAALLAARRASPQEPLVLSELARIYESAKRYEDLADVLLSWVGAINDESELVAINLRLAALYEDDLKRDDDAIGRYKAILQRVPGHSAALAGLGKLYFRTQAWDGLVSIFEAEANTSDDPRQKAAKIYKAAEILEEKLAKQEEAIARYNQCLQLQPGYLPAQKALTRMFEKQGRFHDLVAMYETDLAQTSDREQHISTLNKMALIFEERLQDLDHAIDCMKRILELAQDHLPTIRNLARLYERAGRWRDLIQHHELEASLAGDTKQVLSLHHRSAEVLEEQLKDRPGAIAEYERLLALSPSYLPALKALGRLYAQDGRWQDLIKMYRAESEISASPDQAAALIFKIGELCENKLKDEDAAVASYQEVLTLAPNYFPALRALARIYRGQGHWESLIEVLRSEAANRTDPVERANALFQSAAIWEDQLSRPEMAIEGYQEVLRLTPGHSTALRALERLYTAANNVKELIAILDRETQTAAQPTAKVAASLKLSRLYLDRLNEPSRAAACCEAVLALDPTNLVALKTLERVRAADKSRRSEVRARLAERVGDPKLKSALKLAAATEVEGGSDAVLTELKRAILEDPTDIRLSFALERSLRQAGDFAGLAELYEKRIPKVDDVAEKIELMLRAADLAENKLGDLHRAVRHYRAALDLSPTMLPALQGARRVWLKLGDFASARNALEVEGKISRDVRGALEAFTQAGRLSAEKLNDVDAAVANFRKALERDPLDPAASSGLEELLASRGGGADLAQLHERRGDAKLAQRDLIAAAHEFYSAARVWLNTEDGGRAMSAVERALAAQPSHPEALEMKGNLCLASEQYADAAAAFAARVQQGGDAKTLSAIHLRLGALYQDHLNDASRAAAHLQTAVSGDASAIEPLVRLADIHTVSRNWTGAADCLRRLLELEREPALLAKHTVALAKILDEGFGDPQQASAHYRRALELAPGDPAIVERLVVLYERTGNLPELVSMLEQQAVQAQGTGDVARAVSLRLKVGDLYAKQLGNQAKAVATYRQVVELDRTSVQAHASMADLFMRDAAAGPMAIQEHLNVLKLDPTRVDSLHALFRLWEGLRQTDKAFCAASILQFLRAANDVELAYYSEAKNRLPNEKQEPIPAADLDLLLYPSARNALTEVLRAIGDQLSKLYPPNFEALGVDRKADRLKPDHAVYKAIRSVAQVFGIEEFEVYQARRGMVTLETSEPLSVCVGQDVVRKFNAREQKFLIGRAVMGLLNKTAVLSKLSSGETGDLVGNSIRIHAAGFNGLGRRNEDTVKQLRKAYSRKALKSLEGPAAALAGATRVDVKETLDGLVYSADRAGLLMCGDVMVALNMLLRDDPNFSTVRPEGSDAIAQAMRTRDDLQALIAFALSDDFFRLRQRVGIAV